MRNPTGNVTALLEPLRKLHEGIRDAVVAAMEHQTSEKTALIAAEAGVLVTDASGHPPNARLNTTDDVAWAGYANEKIRQEIEPLLQMALRRRGLGK